MIVCVSRKLKKDRHRSKFITSHLILRFIIARSPSEPSNYHIISIQPKKNKFVNNYYKFKLDTCICNQTNEQVEKSDLSGKIGTHCIRIGLIFPLFSH